jgi:hypothetical protein
VLARGAAQASDPSNDPCPRLSPELFTAGPVPEAQPGPVDPLGGGTDVTDQFLVLFRHLYLRNPDSIMFRQAVREMSEGPILDFGPILRMLRLLNMDRHWSKFLEPPPEGDLQREVGEAMAGADGRWSGQWTEAGRRLIQNLQLFVGEEPFLGDEGWLHQFLATFPDTGARGSAQGSSSSRGSAQAARDHSPAEAQPGRLIPLGYLFPTCRNTGGWAWPEAQPRPVWLSPFEIICEALRSQPRPLAISICDWGLHRSRWHVSFVNLPEDQPRQEEPFEGNWASMQEFLDAFEEGYE